MKPRLSRLLYESLNVTLFVRWVQGASSGLTICSVAEVERATSWNNAQVREHVTPFACQHLSPERTPLLAGNYLERAVDGAHCEGEYREERLD